MSRILLLGSTGLLGKHVCAALESRGHEVVCPSHAELDVTDPVAVAAIAAGTLGSLDVVVNCTAYTKVDQAENEIDDAIDLNALAPGYLAQACAMADLHLLHISTDFVFDGEKPVGYVETDTPNPLNQYGRSKLLGEESIRAGNPNHWILRTAWLYASERPCFPKSILRAWIAGRSIRVVGDQMGSPTYAVELARVIADVLETRPEHGTFHAVGPDQMSWYDLALLTCTIAAAEWDLNPPVIDRITSLDWPTLAARPHQSVLLTHKLEAAGIEPMRPTVDSLADFVRALDHKDLS